MNASDIVRLLNSNHYAPADLDEVNKVCRNYPEFGIAQMLKVRIMEVLGHDKDQALKLAAVYAMDRKKLLQLVTEAGRVPEAEPEAEPEHEPEAEPEHEPEHEPESQSERIPEDAGAIQFTEDENGQADVIIEQHAPYAGQDKPGELLELDQEDGEAFELDAEDLPEDLSEEESGDEQEELTSENLITALVKDDTDMEEPEPDKGEIPAADVDEPEADSSSNNHLIRNFLQEEPGAIRADKETRLKGDVSQSSIQEHDGFITDTLAKIYVKQGLLAKAIYAYERLSLKYPEKSAYFAAQIEKIRNINHS